MIMFHRILVSIVTVCESAISLTVTLDNLSFLPPLAKLLSLEYCNFIGICKFGSLLIYIYGICLTFQVLRFILFIYSKSFSVIIPILPLIDFLSSFGAPDTCLKHLCLTLLVL